MLYCAILVIAERKTVYYNGPVMLFINKRITKAIIIDVNLPSIHNFSKTEMHKKSKCENLALEINTWKLQNVRILPIVIFLKGVITTFLPKNLQNPEILVKIMNIIQRKTLLQTCHIVRTFSEVLNEIKSFSVESMPTKLLKIDFI